MNGAQTDGESKRRVVGTYKQLIVEAAGNCTHLRLGMVERHGRSKSSNDEPPVSANHAVAGFPIRRHPVHVCIARCDLETSREDADDPGSRPVEHDSRANRIVRASQTRLPEAMTDQDQRLPLLGFFARPAASLHGLNTEKWKQVGRDVAADDLFRPFCSRQRRGHGIEYGDVGKGLVLTPPLFDIPGGFGFAVRVR
jgi:hypothetical protein